MNKKRLLKLADLLEADAKNKKGIKFDIYTLGRASQYWDDNGDRIEFDAAIDCGTIACAMGLAAISGEFKRAGLSYRIDDQHIVTTFKGRKMEFDLAAKRLFDISLREAEFLFTPAPYPENKREGAAGERFVAKRIRDLVEGKIGPQNRW